MIRYGKFSLSVGKISAIEPKEKGVLFKLNSLKGCRDDIFYLSKTYVDGMETKIEVGNNVVFATESAKPAYRIEYDEVYKNEVKRLEESMTKKKFDEYIKSDQFEAFKKQHITKNITYPEFKTTFVQILDQDGEIIKGIPYKDSIFKDICIKCLSQSTKR